MFEFPFASILLREVFPGRPGSEVVSWVPIWLLAAAQATGPCFNSYRVAQ